MEAGVVAPVVGRVYELREAPDAIRCVETGHAARSSSSSD
ncbi:MAG: zinc-binding dehydrogenase [Actinobacteria bacterium]|nr:MAG: zinc-binding dehydrogenase [Actinomycetota bacterium]